jgi:hypothetical protein
MRDELIDYRALQKLLDCFTVLHTSDGPDDKPTVALNRIPTLKQLQAIEEIVGELVYRAQMDSLDSPRRLR